MTPGVLQGIVLQLGAGKLPGPGWASPGTTPTPHPLVGGKPQIFVVANMVTQCNLLISRHTYFYVDLLAVLFWM